MATRWFGTNWHAPVNHPDYEVPVPVGTCTYCHKSFSMDSQGLAIPHAGQDFYSYYHLDPCFMRLITGQSVAEILEDERGEEPDQGVEEAGHP